MNTKTVTLPINWLEEIDGNTVAQAISYLMTLDSDYILSCGYFDGDTYGGDIVSEVRYETPMTEEEVSIDKEKRFFEIEKSYLKNIKYHENSMQYFIKIDQSQHADNHERLLFELKEKLDQIKLKYNKQ